MARHLSDEFVGGVRDLIKKIAGCEEGTEKFKTCEKKTLGIIVKGDSMLFFNSREIQRDISNMAQKFNFHGFFKHAENLEMLYSKYVPKTLKGHDLETRLQTVKFLLTLSQSPTTQFWQQPERFHFIDAIKTEEEVLNWGEYLNEGIERWSPCRDESPETSELFLDEGYDETESASVSKITNDRSSVVINQKSEIQIYDFKKSREELLDSIQHTWYNLEKPQIFPASSWFEANVGISWDNHLTESVHNLIQVSPVGIVTEYQAMREILWQMWGPHNSTLFMLSGDQLVVKEDITISSIRAPAFEHFLRSVFIPYIELLDEFRKFFKSLDREVLEDHRDLPETYQSYGQALRNILMPVFEQLVKIEAEVRAQETTMTLLDLAARFEEVFKHVLVLRNIHNDLIPKDLNQKSKMFLALDLLTKLRMSLKSPFCKIEQDLRLAIYLESLYYYFKVIDSWLVRNLLSDYSEEFIVINANSGPNLADETLTEDWEMNFRLRDGSAEFCEKDGIIRIISDQVLQVGRNLHLYRLLVKHGGSMKSEETLHEEFTGKLLDELCLYFDRQPKDSLEKEPEDRVAKKNDERKSSFEDYVDTSDGFLMKAFETYMREEDNQPEERARPATLYEKISAITKNLFPFRDFPERILNGIIKERFTVSGLMVKNLLIEKYSLEKQFDFFSHVFLFRDDFTFPFYRRLFEKMEKSSNWGNSVWLTSHLHDVIMDAYPSFYEHCVVQVNESWRAYTSSAEACSCINFKYGVKWPLNIIITSGHQALYKELFGLILKLKWALYTVNHLSFNDLKANDVVINKLKYLRFALINILNSIQHYVFGYLLSTCQAKFELDFEKSNDLKSLMLAHSNFINSLYVNCINIREKNGFDDVMECVKALKRMWSAGEATSFDRLEDCYNLYKSSFSAISPIVNPVSILYQ